MTQFLEHLTVEGDRWDSLAYLYYGNPYAYNTIVEANISLVGEPQLPSGVKLQIPVLKTTPAKAKEGLPPWRR